MTDRGAAPPQRCAKIVLSPVPASSRRARAFVHAACQRWNLAGHTVAAVAVTTELVENSIIHAGTDLWVGLEPHDGGLVVTVRDGSPLGAVPHASVLRPGGLHVVAHLAAQWGWAPDRTGGKVVWAMLAA